MDFLGAYERGCGFASILGSVFVGTYNRTGSTWGGSYAGQNLQRHYRIGNAWGRQHVSFPGVRAWENDSQDSPAPRMAQVSAREIKQE